ncbi:MAG: HD domain-containing protein [Sulfuricellaceae bacterium]|nr:HD domain-containing protein [Sulfuricellaceae bacterium]
MSRIRKGEIRVGQPLPWTVYDSNGLLLLCKGFIINSERQLDSLIERGLYSNKISAPPKAQAPEENKPPSPFKVLDQFQPRLKRICEDLKTGQQPDIPERILRFGSDLQRLCSCDAEAVLGAVHLIHEGQHTIAHSLHAAILTELFLRAMGISAEDRLSILAAALTHDIGMMDVHDLIYKQQAPLSDEQWAKVHRHPERSVAILEKAGIIDGIWLETVLHHHERLDGSGYPFGLKDEDIFFPARALAIVDIYGAMIKQRAYRESFQANEALREIFLKRAGALDEQLVKIFVKELGIFPPGVFVRLKNREIAVVTHRSGVATSPIAHAIIGPRGAPLSKSIKRDTRNTEFAIHEQVPRENALSINLCSLWGYA